MLNDLQGHKGSKLPEVGRQVVITGANMDIEAGPSCFTMFNSGFGGIDANDRIATLR
jgi:hypothetical protein